MNTHAKPSKLIKGATGDWEVVIGMEVHAQVVSKSKLFSGASTEFGGEPNSHVSLVDAAMPGMLPVINEECVAQAVRSGLGLKAKINLRSRFDRKNYFYPDLPQGYQISPVQEPDRRRGCRQRRCDADGADRGRHRAPASGAGRRQVAARPVADQSFVDLNRSGVALMEIVSKPDMRSADEAKAYVTKLRTILRYLGTCDGNMEQGSLRADVNVSVRRPGERARHALRDQERQFDPLHRPGDRLRGAAADRHLEDGGKIDQETRLFDPDKGETRSMRSKEEAHDYRYFPDPDLLPLEFDQAYVDALAAHLPELPDAKRARFITEYGLPPMTPASWSPTRRRRIITRPPSLMAASRAIPRPSPIGSWAMCRLMRTRSA